MVAFTMTSTATPLVIYSFPEMHLNVAIRILMCKYLVPQAEMEMNMQAVVISSSLYSATSIVIIRYL